MPPSAWPGHRAEVVVLARASRRSSNFDVPPWPTTGPFRAPPSRARCCAGSDDSLPITNSSAPAGAVALVEAKASAPVGIGVHRRACRPSPAIGLLETFGAPAVASAPVSLPRLAGHGGRRRRPRRGRPGRSPGRPASCCCGGRCRSGRSTTPSTVSSPRPSRRAGPKAWSRFGPCVPLVPARLSTWQEPHLPCHEQRPCRCTRSGSSLAPAAGGRQGEGRAPRPSEPLAIHASRAGTLSARRAGRRALAPGAGSSSSRPWAAAITPSATASQP